MIKIFKIERENSYMSLNITFGNQYVIDYTINSNKEVNIHITYYFDAMYNWRTPLDEYEILFNKDIRKAINKFLRIPNSKIINDSLDENNRFVLTHITNRSTLSLIISSIKRELRAKLNGSI